MENVKRETREAVKELREDVNQAGTQLKQKAREATEQIKEQGYEMVTQQKETVTGSLDRFGSALRKAAQHLHEDHEKGFATVTEKLADQIESTTNYLRNHDFQSLYDDAQGYARRHPEVVFGAMFVAGLAIGRFLKASPHTDWDLHRADYVNRSDEPMPAATEDAPMPVRHEDRAMAVEAPATSAF
jgi:hypothetical protein